MFSNATVQNVTLRVVYFVLGAMAMLTAVAYGVI